LLWNVVHSNPVDVAILDVTSIDECNTCGYQRLLAGVVLPSISIFKGANITESNLFPSRLHSMPRMSSRIFAVSTSRANMSSIIASGERSGASSGALGFFTERS